MAGDINIFLGRDADEPKQGELSVMIVEKASLRKGLAQEALELIMHYGIKQFGLTSYIAKIQNNNLPSIKLFEKISFTKVNHFH